MELAKRISIIIGVVMAIAGVAAGLIKYGEDKENINSRTFESPAQMVKTVTYVEEAPSPAEIQRDRILDSIKNAVIIESAKFRDSMMIIERNARKITDSINKLNADQFYQTKKIQDKILQELEIIKRKQ
jgi:hypothetical protein